MTPDVTCLIPAYNAELTLERAVRSTLDQQGVNVELVLIDDCSTDNTAKVAFAIGSTYSNIPIKMASSTTNDRIAATLNKAAMAASGKYFIRLDTDDWFEPGCLARMVAALDAYPDVTFVYGARKYYGRRSDVYTPRPFNADDFNLHNAAGYCYMFRREVWDAGLRWQALGTFGGKVIDLEDWQHLLDMLERGYKGMALPELLVLHYCFRWDGTWQELQDVQPEALAALKARFDKIRAVSL